MMSNRRTVLAASASALSALLPGLPFAKDAEADYDDIATPFPPTYRLFGTRPALGPEEDQARTILRAAPKGKTLIETARYFEQLTQVNSESHMFNAQWPLRWNPVIIGFYQATSLKTSYVYQKGDTIDWCAAFVNWCLRQGGYKRTPNAMSGSFRLNGGLGRATTSPKLGDIVVFKKVDPMEAAVGFGHVGIFVEEAQGGFKILGGNQRAGKRYSSVNTSFFAEKSDRLVLDSIRSFATIGKAT